MPDQIEHDSDGDGIPDHLDDDDDGDGIPDYLEVDTDGDGKVFLILLSHLINYECTNMILRGHFVIDSLIWM